MTPPIVLCVCTAPTPFLLIPSSTTRHLGFSGRPNIQCRSAGRQRRSANWQPTTWDYNYLLKSISPSIEASEETIPERLNQLKMQVAAMLEGEESHGFDSKLELIDILQRLGISYHFESQINNILHQHYTKLNEVKVDGGGNSLHDTALQFRLLRQHGYLVPQKVFHNLKDKMGNFTAWICKDTEGMLAMYEASFLLMEGETLLEEARHFLAKHLKQNQLDTNQKINESLGVLVDHALELPLHWRMLRLEARWFNEFYRNTTNVNLVLLELAKVDFNRVQKSHQHYLSHAIRWWKGTCMGQKLPFARDRLVECFSWTVGVIQDPRFWKSREISTKITALIVVVDDVYDIYGTIDELHQFTEVVLRWDINALEELPYYMKIIFLQLFNISNEIAYDILKEHDTLIISLLRKMWGELCKAYLMEAKWYNEGYTPTFQEYLNNACYSIAATLTIIVPFLYTFPITKECLLSLEPCPNIIRHVAMILRLEDDLGTSWHELERGDVPKAIQCYMKEKGVCEDEAREHIKFLIEVEWKKINETTLKETHLPPTLMDIAKNLAREAKHMYQHGDGHGHNEDNLSKNQFKSLLFDPIL